VDLYHDLPDLVEKANKHTSIRQSEMGEMDRIEFAGLSNDAIEERYREYVYVDASDYLHDLGVTHHVTPAVGVATQRSNSSTC
jgi:hypothetical protein